MRGLSRDDPAIIRAPRQERPDSAPRSRSRRLPRRIPVYTPPPFPASRPRRLRRDESTRALVAESRLHPSDLILPVFVLDGRGTAQDIASMPGVQRLTIDRLLPVAEECVARGIPVMALFPVLDGSLKSVDGR